MLITQFQFQAQQQMQLQQLQQVLIAQNMVSKPPKSARFQKWHKQSRAVQNAPVQEDEKLTPLRRILAVNLPEATQSVEAVAGIFYPYGDATVQILKPGKTLPDDVTSYVEKVPDLGRSYCAIVDLETSRAAKFAVHVLRRREEKVGFRLGLLKPGIEEKLYEQKCLPDKTTTDGDSGITSEHSDVECDQENGNEWTQVGTIRYSREFLLSLQHKNNTRPSGLANLDPILTNQKVENCKTKLIRQPRGPLEGTNGFQRTRRLPKGLFYK